MWLGVAGLRIGDEWLALNPKPEALRFPRIKRLARRSGNIGHHLLGGKPFRKSILGLRVHRIRWCQLRPD